MSIIKIDTPLFEALGAKNVFLKRLEKLGVKTVGDLLRHFPARYDDFSRIMPIGDLVPGEEATVQGVVQDVETKYTRRRGMTIVEAIIGDDTGTIRAVWFNQPYVANALRIGRAVSIAGKVSLAETGELYFNHPAHEALNGSHRTSASRHTGGLIPVYPETRGLTSRGIRFIMGEIFRRKVTIEEWIPEHILEAQNFPSLFQAFTDIHFPASIEDALAAKRRFLFEDLFLLNLLNLQQKLNLAHVAAPRIPVDLDHLRATLTTLPFELTPSQKRSLWEVIQDLEKGQPMNRLLQGDVGSGKTIVAALAALEAAQQGFQTAFMAPTEILARQHFETFQKFFSGLAKEDQPAIGLITAHSATVAYEEGVSGKTKKEDFWNHVTQGKISIIFGTHTLIQRSAKFKNLGLVVIDEQHRFGVRQRQALVGKNPESKIQNSEKKKTKLSPSIPHFLSMSATPIPRTLMMTVFGDLDVSLITELPAGRQPIETKIITPIERTHMYSLVRKQIQEGRQAFVICPRIEEPTEEEKAAQKIAFANIELKAVKTEYERLSKKVFPDLRIAMLHGQMKAKEKESIMSSFANAPEDERIDILVSTSVIEVGVDVPNATIMMIEGADRFGLAQLYQFRGRVGRGSHKSSCFLLTDSSSEATQARLAAIMTANNGFELAERDLALRGPGQFFGEAQTGMPDVAMEALRDAELVKSARDAAMLTIQHDPTLSHAQALADRLALFKKKIHLE